MAQPNRGTVLKRICRYCQGVTPFKRWLRFMSLALLITVLCAGGWPAAAHLPRAGLIAQNLLAQTLPSSSPQSLEQQGRELYDTGRFSEAVTVLQQSAEAYQAQENVLQQAIALGNLSLAYQQLGQWTEANQAIATSLQLLQTVQPQDSATRLSVLAQALDTQGNLQLAQGQVEPAITTWQQAESTYRQVNDPTGVLRSRINQAQALQTQGLYRKAIAILDDALQLQGRSDATPQQLQALLEALPESPNTAFALRSLGDALQVAGDLAQSKLVLQHSLAIAQNLQLTDAIAAAQFSLGNTARAQQDSATALGYYQQAANGSGSRLIHTQTQLNHLSLLLDNHQWSEAEILLPQIRTQLHSLAPGRAAMDAQINFAQSLTRLGCRSSVNQCSNANPELLTEAAQRLARERQQADRLGDEQAQAYILGALGGIYERTRQWEYAQSLTEQALQRAQSVRDADVTYRWLWQLGRLRKQTGDVPGAIAAYESAVSTLQSLRRDVVNSNLSYQLVFRQNAEEPVYRGLLDLLLQADKPSQVNLKKAREVISSLQVAQLENFLQQPCAEADPKSVDAVVKQQALKAAIFYPIILSDRLEIIYKLPQDKTLYHHRSAVTDSELQITIAQLQRDLEEEYTFDAVKAGAHDLYNLLLKEARPRLEQTGIDTLVFVLDKSLRSIPMAALYDGEQYLVEKYAIAIAPGLNLINPQPLKRDQLKVLAAGLTDPPQNVSAIFSKLTNVNTELDQISAAGVALTPIRDANFTRATFNQEINENAFSVVHLATHGQFSSNPQDTYLLTADGEINVNALDSLFRIRGQIRPDVIELLILSACETATGDDLAALGIAGTAVRAGARSTLASLWTLDDTSSVEFTRQLYQHLGQVGINKAQALQIAQKALLHNPQYEHPRYWATYVLVGNWL